MTKESHTGRATVLFAKIVNKDVERDEYELELMGGNRLTIDTTEVEEVEEYICPATGIPVAKVTLDEESKVRTVTKARDLVASVNAPSSEMTMDPLPPFEYLPPRPRPLYLYDVRTTPVLARSPISLDGNPIPVPLYVYDVRTTGW